MQWLSYKKYIGLATFAYFESGQFCVGNSLLMLDYTVFNSIATSFSFVVTDILMKLHIQLLSY